MAVNNISTTVRNAMCDAAVDLFDQSGGSPSAGNGKIRIYTAAFGTLLAELDFGDPAFGAAATGVATANTITDEASAPASGTAAVCRLVDSGDNTMWEGTVSTSGADINLNTTTITTADVVSITSMTVTMPAS